MTDYLLQTNSPPPVKRLRQLSRWVKGMNRHRSATIEDVPFVTFQGRNPTDDECEIYRMKMDDDVFSPLLAAAPWQSDRQKG